MPQEKPDFYVVVTEVNGREMTAAVCAEEFMAWALVITIGPEKARVVGYHGDTHVTDPGEQFAFSVSGQKHG